MKDGGPAFPDANYMRLYKPDMPFNDDSRSPAHNPYMVGHSGMSLRDYFAAAALQGILSSPMTGDIWSSQAEDVAKGCYLYADAMLAERDKPTTQTKDQPKETK